jgi:hypothetical protein
MGRKLIVCCDGTWNEPESASGNRQSTPTNVLKFARALQAVSIEDGHSQIIYYDSGIGTSNRLDRLLGGALGVGLSRNILDAYRFLAMNFHPGDEIFLFGFSRGAYTVRSLSGFIDLIGLLPREDISRLPMAFRYYRTRPDLRSKQKFAELEQFLADNGEAFRRPRIRMIGVWDTVGALGVPLPLLQTLSRRKIGFHDTALANNVDYAYHALALDEKRGPLKPDLWTQSGTAQEIKQVWFAGVHSDVGGGYAAAEATEADAPTRPESLSDTPLLWIVSMAKQHGLKFDPQYLGNEVNPAVSAPLHDSFSLLYRVFDKLGIKQFIRAINTPVYGINGDEMPVNEYLHPSVLDRWESLSMQYEPSNLTARVIATVPVWHSPRPVENVDGAERRRSHRTQLRDVHALIAVAGKEHRCTLLDIAKHEGLRIHSDAEIPVGALIDFNSALTGPLQGRVVWRTSTQAGVKLAA